MAIKPQPVPLSDDAVRVTWALGPGDAAESYGGLHEFADRSVQFEGDFDGGTLAMQGSNSGSTFETLSDPTGVAITATAAKLRQVVEYTAEVKPVATVALGAGAAVTVTLVAKRMRR